MRKLLFTILIITLPGWTIAGQEFYQGLCGYPQTRHPVVNPVSYQSLAKPGMDTDTTFSIRKNVSEQSNEFIDNVPFVRVYSGPEIDIYVEEDEWNSSRVTDQTIENLRRAMLEETGSNSVYPNQGIYESEIDLFGQPPDIDRNGKVFILLIDVRDNYDPANGGSYVAGYFDPADQQPGYANLSDILYIDTNPGLQSGNFDHTMMTAAHEMQHLLHYAADKNEEIWINEGLSEVTAHLFGLPGRNFDHFLSQPTRNLTTFDQTITDYTKVGLWTLYLYSQYSEQILREITRNTENGITGIETVLRTHGYPEFHQVFTNWTIANVGHNYVPEDGRKNQYRYGEFTIPAVTPSLLISNFPSPENNAPIDGYSASYIRVIDGKNVGAQFFPPDGTALTATLVASDNFRYIIDSYPDIIPGQYYDFPDYASYKNGWIIVSNASGAGDNQSYTATVKGQGGIVVESLGYFGGTPRFYLTLAGGTAATDFPLPSNQTQILQASVNLFNQIPVTLELRESKRGALLASQRLASPSRGWNTWNLDTLDMQLAEVSLLVVTESQTDTNGVAYYDSLTYSGNSYFRSIQSSTFIPLNQAEVAGEMLDGDWGMRLQISYPGADTTDQDYPWKHNPWVVSSEQHGNTITMTLQFQETGDLRVDVLNILGQHVKNLARNKYIAANIPETITWSVNNSLGRPVSSGVYFFVLQFNGERQVRKVTVLR